jgi:hypothetical protein
MNIKKQRQTREWAMRNILLVICILSSSFNYFSYVDAQDSLFAPPVNYSAGLIISWVCAGDFNGDGYPDLAVTLSGQRYMSILLNNGNGAFNSPIHYWLGSESYFDCASDLDGDGDIDLAVSTWPLKTVAIIINNGDGTFLPAAIYALGHESYTVFAADLDGDGDNDIILPCYLGFSILINHGNGTFQNALYFTSTGWLRDIYAADLDGDGDKDLAIANEGSPGSVYVYLNNGNATFQAPAIYPTADWVYSIFAADLDGDGDKDIAAAPNGYQSPICLSLLFNNGDGTFQPSINYALYRDPWSVACADIDNDNDNDIVIGTQSDRFFMAKNNGTGSFQPAIQYLGNDSPSPIVVADFDIDGDLDLAFPHLNQLSISICMNRTIHLGIGADPIIPPDTYCLQQNYPNPFNAQTTIGYSVPEQAHVFIDIFDLLGRKVETLNQGMQAAGQYRVIWDASMFSSGMYLYRITAGEKALTGRMLLLK